VRELEQRPGESVAQAYCWDLETNVRREMTFTVPHVRDTRKGRVKLEDARDIYEVVANMGARRVRACILGIIPGDVVEAAVDQVEETLKTTIKVTPERITKLLEVFGGYSVTKAQIEKRIQRKVDTLIDKPALFAQLGKIANSMKDGMSSAGDWFDAEDAKPVEGAPGSATDRVRETLKAKRQAREVETANRETGEVTEPGNAAGTAAAAPAQEKHSEGPPLEMTPPSPRGPGTATAPPAKSSRWKV
jgi:hypothetical protein